MIRSAALATLLAAWASITTVQAAPVSTWDMVRACGASAEAGHPHHLTVAEARSCAPQAPVLASSQAPSSTTSLFIVDTGREAVINFVESTSSATGRGAPSSLLLSRAPRVSASPTLDVQESKTVTGSFTGGMASGTFSDTGYIDHKGYANFPNNISITYSTHSFTSQQTNHYDSTYAMSHYGTPRAGASMTARVLVQAGATTFTTESLTLYVFLYPGGTGSAMASSPEFRS